MTRVAELEAALRAVIDAMPVQQQRTPGPWRTEYRDTKRVTEIYGANGARVGFATADAGVVDAAFIVEACNQHDALAARVADLESVLRSIYVHLCGDDDNAVIREQVAQEARAALAKEIEK